MVKLYSTLDEYVGVPPRVSGPQAVMHPYNFQNIAGNQSLIFERLCNLDCDGTGSPALNNEGHDHTEDHNQPHLPLLFRSYGQENKPVSDTFRPLTVVNDSTDEDDVILIYSPFFVPAGLVGRSLLLVMHIEGDGAPGVHATLATWAGGPPKTPTTVTGHEKLVLQNAANHPAFADNPTRDTLWFVRLYPAAAGLHTIKITTLLETAFAGEQARREIRSILIVNEPHWGSMWGAPHIAKPDRPTANLVDVGDSRNANGWTCPTTHLYPYEGNGPGSLSPGVRFLALNDAWLQEKALGLPAAGQATMTVSAGHRHTGASGDGAEIQIPVLGLPCDRVGTQTTIYGNGSGNELKNQANTYRQVLQFEIYTPDHTYALDEGVNPRLRCAVLMHGEHSKTGGVVTKVSTTESGTPSTTAVEFATDAGLASPHYELVTSTSGLTFTPAGRTLVTVEIKVVSGAATGPGTLMGLCFWISPT